MTGEHRTSSQRPEDPELTEGQERHLGEGDGAPIVTPTPTEVRDHRRDEAGQEPKAETADPDEPEPPAANVQAP
ncbi:hypothetical protein ACFV1L_09895 [Kitasatospora sp. NPDC059646]|uniref:hypothetical protein n=1 Tax=Kitasatospora sp. NPDC059646 TaxID=3346893 RepID=UPI0036841C20